MNKETNNQPIEDYSRMVNGNTILLALEGFIKYIEGFTKGLQTTDKVNSSVVLDCIGEILEYIISFKTQLISLFKYCEEILAENEELKEQIKDLTTLKLQDNLIDEEIENG